MKAKKLLAVLVCVLTVFLLAVFSSAEEEIVPCEHSSDYWKWQHIDQTCTTPGEDRRVCTYTDEAGNVCGRTVALEIIPAHNFNVIYTAKAATCTEEGLETVYCDWCNTIENRVIPIDPDNHSFGEWVITVASTCKDEGVKVRHCSRTGCTASETAAVAVNTGMHDAGNNEWEIIKEPTCAEEGKKKSLCVVCNQVFTKAVPVHYDYAVNTEKYRLAEKQEGNCTQRASEKYFCLDCAASFTVYGERDKDKHDYTDESLWQYSNDANCKHPGTLTKYCKHSRNHSIVETYAPHVFEGVSLITEAPACSADGTFTDGVKTTKCIYCDEVTTETVPGTHSFGDWTITEGSCKEGGKAVRTCDCGQITEDTVFKAGTHLNYTYNPKTNIVYPTCLSDGYLYVVCTEENCGVTARVFIPELDSKGSHTAGDWVVTDKATCEKSGEKELHCDICDAVMEKKVIPQLDHSCIVLEKGYAETCEAAGITDYLYCILCKAVFDQELIPATGHNFVEQFTPEEGSVRICDKCYEYEIIGDDGAAVTCKCFCHNSNGIAKTIWKVITFFSKLFGINQECKCGILHY